MAHDSTMTDKTLFQQLVADTAVEQMINDLENMENLVPEGEDPEDMDGFELAITFGMKDVPALLEELRELQEDSE